MTRTEAVRDAVGTATRAGSHELLRYLKAAMWFVFWGALACLAGGNLESVLWPVLVDQDVSNVHRSKDGTRLCWDWSFRKTHAADPDEASAQLYIGNAMYPVLVGLEHADHSPLGLVRAPMNVAWSNTICISVPDAAWDATRLGIQPIITYHSVIFPWHSIQKQKWIDFYNSDAQTP